MTDAMRLVEVSMNHVTNGEVAVAPVRWFLARLMAHSELDAEEQRAILKLTCQAA